MECRDCTDALTALIDSELSGDEKEQMENHLAICSTCKDDYESLVLVSELTEKMNHLEVSPAVWEQVRTQVDSSFSSQSPFSFDRLRSFFTFPWLPLTAGAAAAVLLVMLITPFGEDTSAVERELDAFMQVREQLADQNAKRLFVPPEKDRDYRAGNPFLQKVDYVRENPFRE
jgi:anti-sigma factor RsiW